VPDYPAGFFILPDIQPNHSAGFLICRISGRIWQAPDIRHPASGKKY